MLRPKIKIKKGDKVIVIAGKEKGKTGEISRVIYKTTRVVIQGLNMVTRHIKPSASNPDGTYTKEMSLHISNVALLDPVKNQPTRMGYKIDKNGKKVRYTKKTGTVI